MVEFLLGFCVSANNTLEIVDILDTYNNLSNLAIWPNYNNLKFFCKNPLAPMKDASLKCFAQQVQINIDRLYSQIR